MQAEQFLFNGFVKDRPLKQESKQSPKFNLVQSFMSLVKNMNLPETGAFILGYLIGELKIKIDDKNNKKLITKITESLQLVRDGLIQQKNLIAAIVETIDIIKNSKQPQNPNKNSKDIQNNNKPKNQPQQKNKMKSEYDFCQDLELLKKISRQNSKIKSTLELFIQTFQSMVSELALDPDYLFNLWCFQQYQEQQELKSKEVIDKIIAQDTQKRQIEQNQKIQCPICLVDIQLSDMTCLQGCQHHVFHIGCIHEHIKASIDSNNLEIKCPMEECKNYLTVNDIETYVQGDILEKYYKFSLNKYVESGDNMTSWCPTAGCPAVFQYDEALDNYRCVVCRKHYCLMCRTDYHYGMSCAEYRINNTFSEDDQKFQDFVRGAKFKQCPKCKFWVQRVAGCSSMACRCGIEFCYDCGGTGCPHGRCIGSGRVNKK